MTILSGFEFLLRFYKWKNYHVLEILFKFNKKCYEEARIINIKFYYKKNSKNIFQSQTLINSLMMLKTGKSYFIQGDKR